VRKAVVVALVALLGLTLASPLAAQAQAKKKRLLAIGASKGFQHDSISQALGTLWKLGQETGLWDTYIRTDTQLITKKKLTGNAKNIDYFDALFFYTTGELDLDDEQKAALLSFVRDDGKGFLGGHSAPDCLYKWPEYGDMLGGYFDQHPWMTFPAPIIVEDRESPITKHFPATFTITDEIYQIKDYSRDKVRVLMRLDPEKVDLKNRNVHRTDKDFAVTWMRNYGKGRVFYCGLGHPENVWDRPDIQKMYTEAIKWAMGMTTADATPRPLPAK
jgi:uncharacterized protein